MSRADLPRWRFSGRDGVVEILLRERMAYLEGLLEGLREEIAGKRVA